MLRYNTNNIKIVMLKGNNLVYTLSFKCSNIKVTIAIQHSTNTL